MEDGGKEIIQEQLRQWYVFETEPEKWWDYMLEFDDNCDDLAVFPECSAKIMKQIGIDYDEITTQVRIKF